MTPYNLIRPLLFRLDPEHSHKLALGLAKQFPFLVPKTEIKNPVKLWNLEFKNPIGLAAGFDKNAEYLDVISRMGFGFAEVGSVTPLPQPGNSKPRLWRLPEQEALRNRMGLNNHGVETVARNIEAFSSLRPRAKGVAGSNPLWIAASASPPRNDGGLILGASFTKNTTTPFTHAINDYIICFEHLEPVADYLVADVSCPNTGELAANSNLDFLDALCAALKSKPSTKPLLLKLSPDWDEAFLTPLAKILIKHHIDGVICGNTSQGLSGKPLFPKALALVQSMRGVVPIIACGGIFGKQDIDTMRQAGASLFQLYTGLIYKGPTVIQELINPTS